MKTLRIGLLVDSVRADKYVHELALWGRSQPDVAITHLVVQARDPVPLCARLGRLWRRDGLLGMAAKILFKLIVLAEKQLLRRSDVHRDHLRAFDLSAVIDRVIELRPIVSPSGHVYRFADADIERLKALELDVLIRCGQGILRGRILEASRFGVLSFHHGDNRVNRGGPAGFWECYYRWPRTGFVIQRLTEELDAGEVLGRGFFATRRYFLLNQADLYKKSLVHLKRLLKRIAATGTLPAAERGPALYSERLLRAPHLGQCVLYGWRAFCRVAVKPLSALLLRRERWGISVLPAAWSAAVLWRAQPAAAPRGREWADPFVWTRDGRTWCFVEDCVRKSGKGRIGVLEIDGTQAIERGVALEEPFHLSFPFLFEYRGALYMCPETAARGQIRVYRCSEFPLKWELEAVLMDGVSAADTMLFERGGRWWMLTSIDESGTGDHCSELFAFWSDAPLSSRWIPHPCNPVRVDSWGGRNAGLIVQDGRIFRAAQCQGFDRYGESLIVNEITELSEARYAERRVARIRPRFRAGLLGTHHLSTDGKTTVVDHLSYSFRG
jgi:hypothetical protein